MQLFALAPARAGHAAFQKDQALRDLVRQCERYKQPDHVRVPMSRPRRPSGKRARNTNTTKTYARPPAMIAEPS